MSLSASVPVLQRSLTSRHSHGRDARVTDSALRDTGVAPVRATRHTRRFHALLPLLLVLLAAAAPHVLFDEPFKQNLSPGWSWLREDKPDWKLADGALHIRLTPGNLWANENTARNLLLRDAPKDVKSFTAEVTLSLSPADFGEQAGLLWYRDDDNYLKLTKEFYNDRTWVVFAAERGGKPDYREAECRGQWVNLRLTVAGDKAAASFLPVGATEAKGMGTFDLPAPRDPNARAAPPVRIGLTAHHGAADSDRWAVFRDFRIVRAE
jgi:regulation of enolase protein 1 (concanavalin A-like superfamily)